MKTKWDPEERKREEKPRDASIDNEGIKKDHDDDDDQVHEENDVDVDFILRETVARIWFYLRAMKFTTKVKRRGRGRSKEEEEEEEEKKTYQRTTDALKYT